MKIVSLQDFVEAVAETARSGEGEFVLIGGLAVGAWTQYYGLDSGGPMFSKDIDFRGTGSWHRHWRRACACGERS